MPIYMVDELLYLGLDDPSLDTVFYAVSFTLTRLGASDHTLEVILTCSETGWLSR